MLVARRGEQAAGLPDGALFGFLHETVRNSDGRTTFRAFLSGSGVDAANDDGYWSIQSGSATPVIREGDHVPRMPEGVKLDGGELHSFARRLSSNTAGELACIARFSGPGIDEANDTAILAGDPSLPRLVAREGQHALGRRMALFLAESSGGLMISTS